MKDMGAVGDGTADDTTAIQSAIDLCAKSGGGVVVVDEGNYKIGTIFLKSNVTIELGQNGKISAKRIESIMRKLLINNCIKMSNIWIYVYFMQNNVKTSVLKGKALLMEEERNF